MERKSLETIQEFSPRGFVRRRVWQSAHLHCNIYCFEPGQQNSLHRHPVADEVVFCWEGEGVIVVGEEHSSIKAGETVDGNDVLAVIAAVERAGEHVRSGKGPALVECKTFRVRGHSEADKADYVPKELRDEWLAKDPIPRFEAYLTKENILTETVKAEIEAKVKTTVSDAVAYAEESPAPDPATVADYVFAPAGLISIVGEPGAADPRYVNALDTRTGKPFTTMDAATIKTPEEVGRR